MALSAIEDLPFDEYFQSVELEESHFNCTSFSPYCLGVMTADTLLTDVVSYASSEEEVQFAATKRCLR